MQTGQTWKGRSHSALVAGGEGTSGRLLPPFEETAGHGRELTPALWPGGGPGWEFLREHGALAGRQGTRPPGESPRCRGPAQDLAVAEPRRETDTSLPLAEDSGPSAPAGPEDGTGGASTSGPPPAAAPLRWGAPPPGSCWAPAPQTPSPRGSPSVSRVSRAHSITRALWGLLCLLHAPGTPKNGLVSVSYSTTQEAAAPRPPQDPHVLAGPALRTLEAQAAWGTAASAALAPPWPWPWPWPWLWPPCSRSIAPLQGLTPKRLTLQRLPCTGKCFCSPDASIFVVAVRCF